MTRLKTVDIAKGMCIVLVAFSHSELAKNFQSLDHSMALFRMPLFFFLSGVFLRERTTFKQELLSRTDYLLKPYLTTLILIFLVSKIVGTHHASWEVEGIFFANVTTIRWGPLWFLPHLWAVHLASHYFSTQTRAQTFSAWFRISCVTLLLLFGIVLMHAFQLMPEHVMDSRMDIHGLPLSIDLLLLTSAFFLAGHFFRDQVLTFKPNTLLVVLAAIVFVLISTFSEAKVNLAYRVYDSWFLSTIAAVCGGYLVVSSAYLVEKSIVSSKLFCFLGLSSLFILIFHMPVDGMIFRALTQHQLSSSVQVASMISFVGCLLIPLAIRVMVIRSDFLSLFYLPLKSSRLRAQKGNHLIA